MNFSPRFVVFVYHKDLKEGANKNYFLLLNFENLIRYHKENFGAHNVSYNDNLFSEALFKTVKYCISCPTKPFKNIEQAARWMVKFTRWYNCEHKHSGIKFVTPYQRHAGLEQDILDKRVQLYECAKKRHSNNWVSNIRCWKVE